MSSPIWSPSPSRVLHCSPAVSFTLIPSAYVSPVPFHLTSAPLHLTHTSTLDTSPAAAASCQHFPILPCASAFTSSSPLRSTALHFKSLYTAHMRFPPCSTTLHTVWQHPRPSHTPTILLTSTWPRLPALTCPLLPPLLIPRLPLLELPCACICLNFPYIKAGRYLERECVKMKAR
jgi:hypothetical protein